MIELDVLLPLLIGAFVVAAVMESALATLFQWRLYQEFFNGRAVKTLVMIYVGYVVVTQFDYDIFDKIIAMAGGKSHAGSMSRFLSACVLAGGSAAIFQLFKTLGLRPPVETLQEKPVPASGKAWVSVRIVRSRAVGDIRIHIDEVSPSVLIAKALDPLSIAGVLGGGANFWQRFKSVFFADSMRFPAYGGKTLETNKNYRIVATGYKRQPGSSEPIAPFVHEIYVGKIADRAALDFVVTI